MGDVLTTITRHNQRAWLFLPAGLPWGLTSKAAVLESDEVPPEREDDADAGIPALAKQLALTRALPVTVLQEVVFNATAQLRTPSPDDLLRAFLYYYDNDAFLEFGG